MPPPRRESPSEESLEPKREVKELRKEGEEEVPDTQEKGEQEEGRERSRRAAAVKATQTLQANEAVSDLHLPPKGRAGRLSQAWVWVAGQRGPGDPHGYRPGTPCS